MDQQLMYIQEKLMEVFPDKLYESLSEIKEQDEQLDRMLSNYTYQTGHTRKQVLSQLGFEKKTYFDIKRLQELLDQYDITLEKMGNFFDRTRELIRQQKIKKALSVSFSILDK